MHVKHTVHCCRHPTNNNDQKRTTTTTTPPPPPPRTPARSAPPSLFLSPLQSKRWGSVYVTSSPDSSSLAHGYLTLPPNPPHHSYPSTPFASSPLPLLALSLALWQPLLLRFRRVFLFLQLLNRSHIYSCRHTQRKAGAATSSLAPRHSPLHPWAVCGFPRLLFYLCTHLVTSVAIVSCCLTYNPHHQHHHTYTGFLCPPSTLFFCFPKLCTYPILPSTSSLADPLFPIFFRHAVAKKVHSCIPTAAPFSGRAQPHQLALFLLPITEILLRFVDPASPPSAFTIDRIVLSSNKLYLFFQVCLLYRPPFVQACHILPRFKAFSLQLATADTWSPGRG